MTMPAAALSLKAGMASIAAAALMLSLTPVVAGAAEYTGNWCLGSQWYVDHAGAEACVKRTGGTPGSWVSLTPAAYDYGRDGHSAANSGRVLQKIGGSWYGPYANWRAVASGGYGTSATAAPRTVSRARGASHLYLEINACTYESRTGQFVSCSGPRGWTLSW